MEVGGILPQFLQKLGDVFVEGFDRASKADCGKFDRVSGAIDFGHP